MDPLEKLAKIFLDFPGIGTRQSKRFAYFLAAQDRGFVERFRDTLALVLKEASFCSHCQRIVTQGLSKGVCGVCGDPTRDHSKLLVLEKDTDFENVQKSGLYEGDYFILGGTLPFVDQSGFVYERIKKLVDRVAKDKNLAEIILACSYTAEGEHTALFVKQQLETTLKNRNIKISQLARGLSTGTELEYSDAATLEHALRNRS